MHILNLSGAHDYPIKLYYTLPTTRTTTNSIFISYNTQLTISHYSSPTGIKLQLELQNTPSFQKIGAAPSPGMLPGYEKGSEYSDDYLEKFVRHQTLTGHHATGTCRMGPSGDHRAVVDNQLRYVDRVATSGKHQWYL